MAPSIKAQQLYAYQNQELGQRTLIATAADSSGIASPANNVIYWDANGNQTPIFTPSVLATDPRMVDSRDYAYFTDGVEADLLKWDIATGVSKWGLDGPVSGPVIGSPIAAGNITILVGRRYYVAFVNTADSSYSDISPGSALTGPLTAQNQPLSDLPVSTDPQVNQKLILATADGGDPTTLYELAQVPNGQTTYVDSTSEPDLVESTVWQQTDTSGVMHGLIGNDPPPNGSFPTENNGRLFLAVGEVLAFSKSLAEVTTTSGVIAGRYEEAWPPDYQLNISTGAEEIKGLLSDGQTLYIATEQHIRRLLGDGPLDFSLPQIVFPETGLLTQNVWQLVFVEGTPVGTMWMTPDLRVMRSDFNTYNDVGTKVQSILNTMNLTASSTCWAVMVSNAAYNLYMLAIPTGTNITPDTFLVYDMHLGQWYVWQCADNFISGIFYTNLAGIPRWIFSDSNGVIRNFDPSFVQDRNTDPVPIGITSLVQTSWLNLGDEAMRKTLNEVEVMTDVSTSLITVEGASNTQTFEAPVNTLVTAAPLTQDIYGDYKVYLAGTIAKDRQYRFTITSTSTADSQEEEVVISYFSFEAIPYNRF